MALDALRSTFRRSPGMPALPSPAWPPAAPAEQPGAAAFEPRTPTFAPAITGWDESDPAVDEPTAVQPTEPYGLPVQPMAASAFEVPRVSQALLAPTDGPARAASTAAATAHSSYAADQYSSVFADPIAGGGTDKAAFGCPTCGRTLDRGTFRCEGCRTWLLLDLPLRRAGTLVGSGLVAGVVVTTILVNLFAPAKVAPDAGLDGASGGTGSGAGVAAIDIPSGATAALRGTTAITARLAAEATPLTKALKAKKFRAGDVQKVLRRMAIDARAGVGMLAALAPWPEAVGQQAALDAFYADLQRQIEAGLSASVRSSGAYKKAAKAILATLESAPALDAAARALGVQAGIQLTPANFPDSLR
jgi:hypothetical protein